MAMDMEKVVLKFRPNEKGTHTIAYCDEYPEIQGIGPDQGHAIANFWKSFNKATEKEEHLSTMKKKEERSSKELSDSSQKKGTHKKAA